MESEIQVSEIETIKGCGEIRRIAKQYITMNPIMMYSKGHANDEDGRQKSDYWKASWRM